VLGLFLQNSLKSLVVLIGRKSTVTAFRSRSGSIYRTYESVFASKNQGSGTLLNDKDLVRNGLRTFRVIGPNFFASLYKEEINVFVPGRGFKLTRIKTDLVGSHSLIC
jgi:hypothetical protein